MAKPPKKTVDQLQSVVTRYRRKTPPFFKKLRTIGLVAAAIGTTIVTATENLPEVATTIAGYLTTAGAVMTAVSQAAVEDEPETENQD